MAFFNPFYHAKDHTYIQPEKKKTSYGRAEKYPNGNINAPWFWGGGGHHMPIPPPQAPTNGIPLGPRFMGSDPMIAPPNLSICPSAGAPWDGPASFYYNGKSPALPPTPNATVNSGPGAGGINSGKMSGRVNYHQGTKPQYLTSENMKNRTYGGTKGEITVARYPNEYAVINQGVGAGRVNSGDNEGSINNFKGTLEF